MSYNAGSIDSKLTLDRSPFSNELRAAKAEAKEFVRNPIKAKLELDRTRAEAELRAFENRMKIATRDRVVNVRVNDQGSTDSARDRLRRLQEEINGVGKSSKKAADDSKRDFNVMRTAIETLIGPATVLAGGLGAMAAGAVALGLVGVIAMKSITHEVKKGSKAGQEYSGQITQMKGDWKQIQDIVAKGVAPGFTQVTTQLHRELPQINGLLVATGGNLTQIVGHLAGGLIGGLHTFTPLIMEIEHGAVAVSAAFERWATGSGGERFMQILQTDLHATVGFLQQAGPALVHVLSGLNTFGLTGLGLLTNLLGIVNKLAGHDGLQALTIGYLAFRTAAAVTTPLNMATAALERFAAAEATAAAAGAGGGRAGLGSRLAGVGAGFLSSLRPILTTVGTTVLALNAAANATNSWASSTNRLKYEIHSALVPFNTAPWHVMDVLNRNARNQANLQQLQDRFSPSPFLPGTGTGVGGFGKTPPQLNDIGANMTVEAAAAVRSRLAVQLAGTNAAIAQATATKNQLWAQYLAAPKGAAMRLQDGTVYGHQQSPQQTATNAAYQSSITALTALNQKRVEERRGLAESQAALAAYNATYNHYMQTVQQANSRGLAATFRETQGQGLSATAAGLGQYTSAIQKNIDAESKWTDTSKGATVQIGNMKVSAAAAQAALDAANGSVPRAEALLHAHADALKLDQQQLHNVQMEQERLNTAVGAAASQYGLTTQQVDLYAQATGITSQMVATGVVSQAAFSRAIGAVADAVKTGSVTLDNWVAAVQQFAQAGDSAASRAQLLQAGMIALNGDALQYANQMVGAADANQKLINDFGQMGKGVLHLKSGFIDYHNAGAAPVLADLQQLQTAAAQAAAATYQHEVATLGSKQAAADAAAVYRNDTRGALVDEATQLGLTRGEAEKLADRYFKWPKDATTQIKMLGGQDTNSLLDALGRQLSYLTGHPWVFTVDAALTPYAKHLMNSSAGRKAGISFALAGGGLIESYAGGGERHVPQIATPGANAVRVWAEPETRGEAYIPLANDWRRPRAKAILSETARRMGGVAFFAAGGGPGETGGYTGVTAPKSGSGGHSGGSGVSSKAKAPKAPKLTPAQQALFALEKQATGEYQSFDTHNEFAALANKSISAIQAAVGKITATINAARTAKAVPSSLVKQFYADNAALNRALTDRERWAAKVKADQQQLAQDQANLKQYGQQVTQNILGGFDINTSGNGYAYGIQASLENRIKDVTRMNDLVSKAKKLGLDPRLVEQLEAQGTQGAANLEAIVGAGKGYVGTLNSDYSKLYGLATSTGATAMQDNVEINKQIAADNKAIKADSAKQLEAQREVNKHLAQIRNDTQVMRKDIADALTASRKKK